MRKNLIVSIIFVLFFIISGCGGEEDCRLVTEMKEGYKCNENSGFWEKLKDGEDGGGDKNCENYINDGCSYKFCETEDSKWYEYNGQKFKCEGSGEDVYCSDAEEELFEACNNDPCSYGYRKCIDGNSYFCGYSDAGDEPLWLFSETCDYGCNKQTGECSY